MEWVDLEKLPHDEFRNYAKEENLLCWSYHKFPIDFYVFKKAHPPPHDDGVALGRLIDFLKRDGFYIGTFLVQFWAAEEDDDISGSNSRLTTRNQPFLLGGYWSNKSLLEGLCGYRMKTFDVIVTRDGGGGAIGRLFQNKRIEYTPNVGYYSPEEYPYRDVAISCDVKNSIVVPWFDSYGKVVGAIEFVSPGAPVHHIFTQFLEFSDGYLSLSLRGIDRCEGPCSQDLEMDLLSSALSEIKEVLEAPVFESLGMIIARTWMLCNSCNLLSPSHYCTQSSAFKSSFRSHYYFQNGGTSSKLRKGDGVVGKAAESSHDLVYCENVSRFSIIDYPLAHFARLYNLSACFALCLRSSYTGDQVYILEFFLKSERVKGKDLRTMFVPILDLMNRNFQTFKFASGREKLGDRLHVLVIEPNSPDKLETLELGVDKILKTNGELGRLPFIQGSIEESSKSSTDDSMNGLETSSQNTSMEYATYASYSTVQSELHVTIKAKYGEDRFIEFQLSASSRIHQLYHQLSQRLGLVDGTYNLQYQDEDNDLIELICDEDLQLFISNSINSEISTLMVFIVPE